MHTVMISLIGRSSPSFHWYVATGGGYHDTAVFAIAEAESFILLPALSRGGGGVFVDHSGPKSLPSSRVRATLAPGHRRSCKWKPEATRSWGRCRSCPMNSVDSSGVGKNRLETGRSAWECLSCRKVSREGIGRVKRCWVERSRETEGRVIGKWSLCKIALIACIPSASRRCSRPYISVQCIQPLPLFGSSSDTFASPPPLEKALFLAGGSSFYF